MLAKSYRITKDQDFETVKKRGRSYQSKSFKLSVYDRKDNEPTRFGFIVSKTISNNASARNKARRALSEGVRYTMHALPKGHDCVVVAKPTIIKSYTSDIMQEITSILRKARLMK